MRYLLISFFYVFATFAHGQNLGTYDHLKKLIIRLGADDVYLRKQAAAEIVSAGQIAVDAIIAVYPKQEFMIRRELTTVLGKIAGEKAITFLFFCLQDTDWGVRNRAISALLELVDHVPGLEQKIDKIHHPEPEIQRDIKLLQKTIVAKKIEQSLHQLISPQGGWGFYKGQFKNLLPLKGKAVPVLLDIFTNDHYFFVTKEYDQDMYRGQIMRNLAGDAIAEFGPFMDKRTKTYVIRRMQSLQNNSDKEYWKTATYTLYKLGDTRHLNSKISILSSRINSYQSAVRRYNSRDMRKELSRAYADLAMIYLRLNKDQQAIRLLNSAISNYPESSLNYYNLACAYSCLGKIEEGVQVLEKLVEKGYNDIGWIRRDGDLNNLRKNPRYARLMEKLAKELGK